jgi:hypothetical protein
VTLSLENLIAAGLVAWVALSLILIGMGIW